MTLTSITFRGRTVLAGIALALLAYPQSQSRLVNDQKTGTYQILDFRLRLNSILPATVTVPEGRYLIRLSNGITPDEIPVVLDDDKGAKVVEDNQGRGQGKSTRLVDLKPGVHRIYVPGRAQWSASITVSKKL